MIASTEIASSLQSPLRASCISSRSSPLKVHMNSGDDTNSESQALINIARSFATTNLGVSDPSMLANDFTCSGPTFNGIEKISYVAGLTKETAVFQRAIPDFDLRPYSFSVDETQANTVWFKIRPRGTITGPFAYKGEVYLPNQKIIEMPAQQLSVTIRSGQITRVTAGYTIDRFTGNTGGLAGPPGVLYALGEAPSKFSYIPPAVVIRQFLQRTKKLVKRKPVKVSPFPLAVMISLAKRVVETSLGAEEESLLSSDFQFSGPLVGPLEKTEFLGALKSFNLKSPFPDLKTEACCYEVDSYDPERVWVISRGSGTQTGPLILGGKVVMEPSGNSYVGPPEAVSVSFNEQGLCYRASAGYILDKEQGNTKGLGGIFGIFEAIGSPLPWWESRTIDELPGLIKDSLFPPTPAPTSARKISPPPTLPVQIAKEITVVADNIDVTVAVKSPAAPPAVAKFAPPKVSTLASKKTEVKKTVEPKEVVVTSVSQAKPEVDAKKSFLSFLNPVSLPKKAIASVALSVETDTPIVVAPKAKKAVSVPVPSKNIPSAPVIVKAPIGKVDQKQKAAVVTRLSETVPLPVAVTEKPKSTGMFSFKVSKGNMGEKKGPIVIPSPDVPTAPIVEVKPKATGGMFSMKISQGSTGKLSTGLSKDKIVSIVKKTSK